MERSKTLRIRVNETELRMIETLADFQERKLSETVREAIREVATERGLWPVNQVQQRMEAGA